MSATNKEIVEKINDAFSQGNTEGFLSYCEDNVVWRMVGSKIVTGKDAVRQFISSMDNMEPPKFTVDSLIADADLVMAHGDMTMADEGGKPAPYRYCDIYRFRNGKVAELFSYVIKTEAESDFETAGEQAKSA